MTLRSLGLGQDQPAMAIKNSVNAIAPEALKRYEPKLETNISYSLGHELIRFCRSWVKRSSHRNVGGIPIDDLLSTVI